MVLIKMFKFNSTNFIVKLRRIGHFGREQFPWEKVDRAEELRAAAGLK